MPSPHEEQIARLTQRVYRLERELDELRRGLNAPPAPARPMTPGHVSAPPATRARPTVSPATREPRDEAEVFGAWFARIGVVVLLIGCGFAFKYAVDQGVLGPSARVALGLAAGIGLVAASEWASRRGWTGWSQAVAGGGVAITYLSVLAAVQLYDLIDAAPAFVCLVVITAGGGLLAVRHDSLVLALLATAGGYLNAVLLTSEQPRPLAVLSYLLALEVGVLGLAFVRRWRALDWAALLGTAVVFAMTAGDTDFGVRIAFVTMYVVLLVAFSVARALRGSVDTGDVVLAATGALMYFAYVADLLNRFGFRDKQGALALTMGVAVVATGFAMRRRSEPLYKGFLLLGLIFAVLFVPIQFEGQIVSAGFAVEASLLVWAGSTRPLRTLRTFGAALLGLSMLTFLAQFENFVPDRLLLSGDSAAFVVEIVAFGLVAWFLRDGAEPLPAESAVIGALSAIALAIAWVSVEVTAQLDRSGASDQALQFSLSAVWGVFATVVLAVGVRLRMRWVRLAGVALFGIVLLKLAFDDLWTLSTSYRFIAFVGLGAVLLACSLGFYRFRDYLVGPGLSSPHPSPPSRASKSA